MKMCNQCCREMQISRVGNHLSPFKDENGDARINVYFVYHCPECDRRIFRRYSFIHDSTWDWDLGEEDYSEEIARIEQQAKR